MVGNHVSPSIVLTHFPMHSSHLAAFPQDLSCLCPAKQDDNPGIEQRDLSIEPVRLTDSQLIGVRLTIVWRTTFDTVGDIDALPCPPGVPGPHRSIRPSAVPSHLRRVRRAYGFDAADIFDSAGYLESYVATFLDDLMFS